MPSPLTGGGDAGEAGLAGKRWLARLEADYRLSHGRCSVHHRHEGPLRLLKSLYPEGPAICHSVLVHPPSGLVGGDTLDIAMTVGEGAHALVTTPGATRFYRSPTGAAATQRVTAALQPGARLEWLPLEAIAYPGCEAFNEARFSLAPGAELLAWDITAFGLPGAGQAFDHGRFIQHLEIPGVWLEHGCLSADDALLMDGALGLAGQRCMGTLVFAAGGGLARERRERALDVVRERIEADALRTRAGATAAQDGVLVVRVLGPVVEPVAALLRQCWAAWRHELWGLAGTAPRLWSM
ncbi:urease accessory protein UreD [Roseateles amylovorans]|uniref:Urease accessory protein UreD n=1 Tax=Roseateles amylovorans TaxID=2978473 RepID=A0ABY6BA71_9BURK|nr:urease accessory protein UreD [Roseateles amylovorans]UXH80812.1 urease accessory protein UreD [Roseateles amylovorans]